MIDWLQPIVPHLKALHVVGLTLWTAGLFAIPLMLARHHHSIGQADYSRIRLATHFGYTAAVTPAAMITVGSGILLIFLREVFVPWFFAKLVFVALLVAFHAWVGSKLVKVAETRGDHNPPAPLAPLLILLLPVVAILFLVLAKPALERVPYPDWLMEPRGNQLPFGVPPRL